MAPGYLCPWLCRGPGTARHVCEGKKQHAEPGALKESSDIQNRLGVHALRQSPEYGMWLSGQSQEPHANWSLVVAPLGLSIH